MGLYNVRSLTIAPSSHNILYAGTLVSTAFRSTDRGETWVGVAGGLQGLQVNALAVDPVDPNHVLAATTGGSVMSLQFREPPRIMSVFLEGKNLVILGEGFKPGAFIMVDDERQKTILDEQNPNRLLGKKTGKRLAVGQTVVIKVQNPDGSVSEGFSFTRSS